MDSSGAPLDGARVVCLQGSEAIDAGCGSNGRFTARISEPAGVVRCIAWADRWAVAVGNWAALADGWVLDVGKISLAPAARISGRVVDESGDAVSGHCWWVTIDGSEVFGAETWAALAEIGNFEERSNVGYAASDVAFEFGSLPPGRYRLSVRRWSDRDSRAVTVDEVTVVAPAVDVVLCARDPDAGHPPPLDLRVRLRRPPGASASDVPISFDVDEEEASRIEWGAGHDEDDDTWEVRLWDPVLPLRLTAEDGDGTRGVAVLEGAPTEEVVIELRPPRADAPAIVGTVTSGGVPVRWAHGFREARFTSSTSNAGFLVGNKVGVFAMRADGEGEESFSMAEPDGTFRIEGLDDAEYSVYASVRESGVVSLALACARVLARPGVQVTLEMPRAGRRVFRVLLPDGAAPADVEAWTEPLDGSLDDSTTNSAGDVVTVTRLRPGDPYRLIARARLGRAWTAWTRFEGWTAGEGTIDVPLDPGLRIEGRVVREDGSPVVGAWLEAEGGPEFDDEVRASTGLDGRFSLAGVSSGPWRIWAYAPGLSHGDGRLEVPGGSTGVVVVLRPDRGE